MDNNVADTKQDLKLGTFRGRPSHFRGHSIPPPIKENILKPKNFLKSSVYPPKYDMEPAIPDSHPAVLGEPANVLSRKAHQYLTDSDSDEDALSLSSLSEEDLDQYQQESYLRGPKSARFPRIVDSPQHSPTRRPFSVPTTFHNIMEPISSSNELRLQGQGINHKRVPPVSSDKRRRRAFHTKYPTAVSSNTSSAFLLKYPLLIWSQNSLFLKSLNRGILPTLSVIKPASLGTQRCPKLLPSQFHKWSYYNRHNEQNVSIRGRSKLQVVGKMCLQ